ncbi:MAG: sigma-70 family RNA polymerase sigma factor [Desulfobacterales bacterium]|nr:sigma-70 family RNA polymerase sigma factor [Desulfobacterales bacterium]
MEPCLSNTSQWKSGKAIRFKMEKRNLEKESGVLHEFWAHGRKDKLIQEYWNLVYLIVEKTLIFHRIPYSKEDIEDLRNEVFYQLFVNECRRLKQFDTKKGGSLSKWVKVIANQTVLNEIKKKGLLELSKRRRRIPMEEIEGILVADEEGRLIARETLRLIKDAMKKLSPKDQAVLKHLYYEWLSLKEIASSINKTENAARAIIFRAQKRLKGLVEGRVNTKLEGANRGESSASGSH